MSTKIEVDLEKYIYIFEKVLKPVSFTRNKNILSLLTTNF